jgi:hypothetical protein
MYEIARVQLQTLEFAYLLQAICRPRGTSKRASQYTTVGALTKRLLTAQRRGSTSMSRALDQAWHRAAYLVLQQLRGRPVGRFIRALQAREKLDPDAFRRLIDGELKE